MKNIWVSPRSKLDFGTNTWVSPRFKLDFGGGGGACKFIIDEAQVLMGLVLV
jgi:hypothetical protein